MSEDLIKLPCCGYYDATAIKWNSFNGVVQCHNCGQVYSALSQQTEPIGEVKESGVVWANQNPHAYPIGTKFYTAQPSGVREGMLRAAEIAKSEIEKDCCCDGCETAEVIAQRITRAADQVNTDTVSVPKEPTQEMIKAGARGYIGDLWVSHEVKITAAYQAMLRAAQEAK